LTRPGRKRKRRRRRRRRREKERERKEWKENAIVIGWWRRCGTAETQGDCAFCSLCEVAVHRGAVAKQQQWPVYLVASAGETLVQPLPIPSLSLTPPFYSSSERSGLWSFLPLGKILVTLNARIASCQAVRMKEEARGDQGDEAVAAYEWLENSQISHKTKHRCWKQTPAVLLARHPNLKEEQ
jgi:hypothetical protein